MFIGILQNNVRSSFSLLFAKVVNVNVRNNMSISKVDIQLYTRCIDFAAKKHRNQRRMDIEETPYINHPIGVADILANEADIQDQTVLMSAILHDTVEDTDTTLAEIEENFGFAVRSIVEELTDDKTLPKAERKRLQIKHAPLTSHCGKLVKLADKLYNLRDLERRKPRGWSDERRDEYFLWAMQVVDGLRGTSAILERELDAIFRKKGILD